tara:strand:+ start:309 stop:578 length:270 start_codon:yes stop_codon:yes gene_type:complete
MTNTINKVKCEKTWDGYNFQVFINNKKYPRERGQWYKPLGNQPRDTAIAWAISESRGRYLARNGRSYATKEEYYKEQEDLGYSYVRPEN